MAKKQETVSMIDSLQEFKDLKNIDKETMINVLEESFRNVIAKMFGTDENYDVIINPEKGDFEIWRNRTVVENGHVSDPNLEVSLRDAQQIDADCTIGEEVTDEVHFADFGRTECALDIECGVGGVVYDVDILVAQLADDAADT